MDFSQAHTVTGIYKFLQFLEKIENAKLQMLIFKIFALLNKNAGFTGSKMQLSLLVDLVVHTSFIQTVLTWNSAFFKLKIHAVTETGLQLYFLLACSNAHPQCKRRISEPYCALR